jgi:hypothetical protein
MSLRPNDPRTRVWVPGWKTYLFVLGVYILIGMEVHFLLSWTRGFIIPFLGIWAIPYLYFWWRGRGRDTDVTLERGESSETWRDVSDESSA